MAHPRRSAANGRAVALLGAILALASAVPWAAAVRGVSTITVLPVADAYVQSGAPASNYGTATALRVRAPSPAYRTYLKFDVAGLGGPAARARLRLNVTDPSRDAGAVYVVASTWTETTINWNNAPTIPTAAIVPIGAAALGWIDIDLGGTVSGDGTYALAIATTSTDSMYVSSREGANPPQLVLDVGAPSPSAGASASAGPSGPPSASPSATSSISPSAPPSPLPIASSSASPTPSPSASATAPPPTTRTFASTADAQVRQANPVTNYGTIATLRLRAGPTDAYRSYVMFTVAGIVDPIASVRLRLFVTDPSPDGGQLFVVASTWTETGITWSNAPSLPAQPLAPSPGAAVTGTWLEWDVGGAVGGNGTFAFALANASTNSLYVSSREGSSPPQLVVATGATSPPVADFTQNVTAGYVPLSVTFGDRSVAASGWAWDFQNDGSTDSTAQNPMFTFATAATYSVRLTVTNSVGTSSIVRSYLITVADLPPPGPVTGTLVGAGDIADCLVDTDEATARLLDSIGGTVFTAGDDAYESGTSTEFSTCYDPTWGRHRLRTLPAPGNHEYQTAGATGYFGYFGGAGGDPTKGYYSTDVGSWHVVILNSDCTDIVGGCAAGGAQEQWLRADLAASAAACTVAIWHHPLFSSGTHGSNVSVGPLWQALYEAGADVVINGHDHDYERFAPQNPLGGPDPSFGIREFVAGTGGTGLRATVTVAPNSEIRNGDTFGVLKVTLHAGSFDWAFVPIAGSTFTDSGSALCHGRPSG